MVPEMFSNLPWPYGWRSSAASLAFRTAKRAMRAATRSTAEWMASDMTATDPMRSPTAILRRMRTVLEQTDRMATPVFRRLRPIPRGGATGGGAGSVAPFLLCLISTISASRHEKAPRDCTASRRAFASAARSSKPGYTASLLARGQGRAACSARV